MTISFPISLDIAVTVFAKLGQWPGCSELLQYYENKVKEAVKKIGGSSLSYSVTESFLKAEAKNDERLSKPLILLNEIRTDILEKLKKGEIEGYGFVEPRKIDDLRHKIPMDVWKNGPSINWRFNLVKGQGLEFLSVEIRRLSLSHDQEPKYSKKPGRPSVQGFILEAYEHLKLDRKIDFFGPKSAVYGPVCDWLAIEYPERATEFKSMDVSTIRKAISQKFDLDRSTQKK